MCSALVIVLCNLILDPIQAGLLMVTPLPAVCVKYLTLSRSVPRARVMKQKCDGSHRLAFACPLNSSTAACMAPGGRPWHGSRRGTCGAVTREAEGECGKRPLSDLNLQPV